MIPEVVACNFRNNFSTKKESLEKNKISMFVKQLHPSLNAKFRIDVLVLFIYQFNMMQSVIIYYLIVTYIITVKINEYLHTLF